MSVCRSDGSRIRGRRPILKRSIPLRYNHLRQRRYHGGDDDSPQEVDHHTTAGSVPPDGNVGASMAYEEDVGDRGKCGRICEEARMINLVLVIMSTGFSTAATIGLCEGMGNPRWWGILLVSSLGVVVNGVAILQKLEELNERPE